MNKEVAGQDSQAKAHKKAKTIIVVNNPQNSRMKNGNSGNNDRRNNNGTVQKMTGAEMMETEEARTVRVTETTMACVWKADR